MDHNEVLVNLSAYKDGELAENLREQIFRHLELCESCSVVAKELDQIDSMIRRVPEISVSEAFVSEIIARTQAAKTAPQLKPSLPHKILNRFLLMADTVFELLPGYEFQRTGSLDEFGDFPPFSLSHAYFQLIGQTR